MTQKQISEIMLNCTIKNLKRVLAIYTSAKGMHKHANTIRAIKKDFFLYMRELKERLQWQQKYNNELKIYEENQEFFDYLTNNYGAYIAN